MIVIPGDYLEFIDCDKCGKFLSVLPIKRYPDGQILCGRCTLEMPLESGVMNDPFGVMIVQGYFKCINRFDGCRQVFPIRMTYLHERWCTSKLYKCPICLLPIFTYYMMKHFKVYHDKYLMESNMFTVELNPEEYSSRLHRVDDNLFIIDCKILTFDTFTLNTFFLGDRTSVGTTQKFTVQVGDAIIETARVPTCFIGDTSEGIAIDTQDKAQVPRTVTVTVHVALGDLEMILASTPSVLLPRRIALLDPKDEKFTVRNSATALATTVVQTNELQDATLREYTIEFGMYCVICGNAPKSVQHVVNRGPHSFQYICVLCTKYVSHFSPKTSVLPTRCVLPEVEQVSLWFACIWSNWGCKGLFRPDELKRHEVACVSQVFQACPIPECTYFGALHHFSDHFPAAHPTIRLYLESNEIEFVKYPVPYPLYAVVWAGYGFITMVFTQDKINRQYSVRLRQPKELETFGKLNAVVMVVEKVVLTKTVRVTPVQGHAEATFKMRSRVMFNCYFA